MSDNVLINFADLADYTPYDGAGSAVLLPFDGMVRAKVIKFKTGSSKGGNKTVKLVLAITEDNVAGTLYADIPVTGKDKNGEPLIRKFGDFLTSAGKSLDEIKAAAASGQQVPVDTIMEQMIEGSVQVFVEVEASTYNGKRSSKITNFVSPQRFSDAVTAGTHRRPRIDTNGAMNTTAASTAGSQAGAQALAGILG